MKCYSGSIFALMQYLFKQAHRIHMPPLMQYQSIRFNLQAKKKEKKEDTEFGAIAKIQDHLAGFQVATVYAY